MSLATCADRALNPYRESSGGGALLAALLACVCILIASALPAQAQCAAKVCTVTSEADLVTAITYANATVGTTINLQSNIKLTAELPAFEAIDVIFNGGNKTLDGDGSFRGLFVLSGLARIENIDIANAVARGGEGSGGVDDGGGGGGAGLGGGLFVTDGATVTVSNVTITDSNAYGGNGGGSEFSSGGGGGGGLRGNGGAPGTEPTGGGGGGRLGDGGAGGLVEGGTGGLGGGGNGGCDVCAGDSGDRFGGGGGGGAAREGGAGGFGGGGGGGGPLGGDGGEGGFGGGGGAGGVIDTHASGGFGGGDGAQEAGGGGAGMGGGIFVMEGGTLLVEGALTVSGNGVIGGTSGGAPAQDGKAYGAGMFLQGNGTITFLPGQGDTQTVNDRISDQTGEGGTGDDAGSWGLVKKGAGTLVLRANNLFSGGVTVEAGTLTLADDAAAGTGTITTLGSVIDYYVGVAVANAVNINSNTTQLQVTTATATQSGVISETNGPRPLEKTGAGTLVLSGANTFTGPMTVSDGTLELQNGTALADSVAVRVASGAALTIVNTETIGSLAGAGTVNLGALQTLTTGGNNASTTFSGRISGDGALVKDGSGILMLSGSSDFTGGTTVAAGTLGLASDTAVGTGSIDVGSTLDYAHGVSIANDIGVQADTARLSVRAGVATQSGVLSDAGGTQLEKTGWGTLILSGANTYSGATTVSSGLLVVNGSIDNSAVTVGFGGALGGTGSTGALTVNFGGIHAPGNSIGTQTVNGAYTLSPAGILIVEANAAGQSDKVVVNGTVTLTDSILAVLAKFGDYSVATNYTIIDNDGADAVTGTFGAVAVSSIFLDASIDYAGGDGNDVILRLVRNELKLIDLAQTINERAVAYALDQFPTENPIFEQIFALDGNTARAAYNALTGEVHATLPGVLANQSWFLRETVLARLVQAYHGGGAGGTTNVSLLGSGGPTTVATLGATPIMGLGVQEEAPPGYDAPLPLPAYGTGLTFWTQGFGSWGDFDGNGNAASAKRTLGGFLSGVDAGLGGNWRAGLATGYTQTSVSVDERLSAAQIDSYNLIGYAGGGLGAVALRGAAAWTWHGIDSTRTVYFPGFLEFEGASYNGDTGQVFAEAAVPVTMGTVAMEPYAGLAYVHVATGGFAESGAVAGLSSAGSADDVGYTTLGLRAAAALPAAGVQVTPRLSLAWQHAFGDVSPGAALAFNTNGIGFGVYGVPIAQDTALIEAGLGVAIAPDATLSFSYQGQLSGDIQDNGLTGSFDWRF